MSAAIQPKTPKTCLITAPYKSYRPLLKRHGRLARGRSASLAGSAGHRSALRNRTKRPDRETGQAEQELKTNSGRISVRRAQRLNAASVPTDRTGIRSNSAARSNRTPSPASAAGYWPPQGHMYLIRKAKRKLNVHLLWVVAPRSGKTLFCVKNDRQQCRKFEKKSQCLLT
jgi:hypothetical protein